MPSGRTHTTINLTVLGLGVGWAWVEGRLPLSIETPTAALGVGAYLLGTFLFSPDLDLANESPTVSKRAWGALGVLWVPYGWLFRHRGLSHRWILGPLTRLLYLAALLLLPFQMLHRAFPELELPLQLFAATWSVPEWLAVLIGYYLSQWLHLIADGIGPARG